MNPVKFLRNTAVEILRKDPRAQRVDRSLDDCKILAGQMLARSRQSSAPASLRDVEFRVFSQFGDDGIIDYLAARLQPTSETFVELGVGDYTESNTRFLLVNRHWRGFICDGDRRFVQRIRGDAITWQFGLTATDRFITRSNVNELLSEHGFVGDTGLLSIDLDGNDYFIWEALTVVDPAIVVMEYNAVFGDGAPVSVPYNDGFQRFAGHYSGLYWGTSLPALRWLATRKGYAFIGCNSAGNNAYFVRQSLLERLPEGLRSGVFVDAKFRDSRGPDGRLTHLSGGARRAEIAHLPVVDVSTGQTQALKDVWG